MSISCNQHVHCKTFIPSNPYQKGSSSSILYFLRNTHLTIRNLCLTMLSLKIRNFKRKTAMVLQHSGWCGIWTQVSSMRGQYSTNEPPKHPLVNGTFSINLYFFSKFLCQNVDKNLFLNVRYILLSFRAEGINVWECTFHLTVKKGPGKGQV